MREKSDELIKKVKEHTLESEKDMKTIMTKIEIPNEPMRQYIKAISSLSLAEALKRISTDNSFIPSVQGIKSELEKQKGKSLALVIPIVSIRDGNPSLRSQTDDEIFEDNVVMSFSLDYKLRMSLLGIAIDELAKTKNLNSETLLSYLLASKVYESNSQKILKAGFERYFFWRLH